MEEVGIWKIILENRKSKPRWSTVTLVQTLAKRVWMFLQECKYDAYISLWNTQKHNMPTWFFLFFIYFSTHSLSSYLSKVPLLYVSLLTSTFMGGERFGKKNWGGRFFFLCSVLQSYPFLSSVEYCMFVKKKHQKRKVCSFHFLQSNGSYIAFLTGKHKCIIRGHC